MHLPKAARSYCLFAAAVRPEIATGEAITLEAAIDWSDSLVRFFKIKATDVAP